MTIAQTIYSTRYADDIDENWCKMASIAAERAKEVNDDYENEERECIFEDGSALVFRAYGFDTVCR